MVGIYSYQYHVFLFLLVHTINTHKVTCFQSGLRVELGAPFRCLPHPRNPMELTALAARRYGLPIMDDSNEELRSQDGNPTNTYGNDEAKKRRESDFRNLVKDLMTIPDPIHVPSLLTRNLELIFSVIGDRDDGFQLIESIREETRTEFGEKAAGEVSSAMDLILAFAESFVEQTSGYDKQNKELLGRIIKLISDKERTANTREQALDELLEKEKTHLSAGFLRHLDRECGRIMAAPTMSPESTRLLQMLRVIQTRVLEELGTELGEAALVLGQLVGYETESERLAVLEAGLSVRGPDFAQELWQQTDEALEGFTRVVGGADPKLVHIIRQINAHVREYLHHNPQTGVENSK